MTKDTCYANAQGSNAAQANPAQKLMSVDDALAFILSKAAPLTDIEDLEISRALGRVLARPQISTLNVPPADNSAMDGYALASDDLSADSDTRLRISQRIAAGQTSQALTPGTAARIFTGAPIPPGADCVVMQEHCRVEGDAVIISPPLHAGQNIRARGEDIKSGVTILDAGIKLRPQDLGLAASIGVAQLPVYRPLRVAIFCTGDELTEPNTPLAPGKIYNANRYTLTSLLHTLHCEIIDFGIVPDNLAATRTVLAAAAQQSDLIITSGGVSVGDEDHVKATVEALGRLEMWRIAMKPGKPLAFGHVDKTPFFGLPGNPVSVFATFCLFARPFILRCQGMVKTLPQSFLVRADFDWLQKGNRREYLRARLYTDAAGITGAVIYPNQGSAALTSISWAHGLVCIAEDATVQRGQMVSFIPFNELLA